MAPCRLATAIDGGEGGLGLGGLWRRDGEQALALEPVELGLEVALPAAIGLGQRVVQQTQRLLWPACQLLGLGQQGQQQRR